MILHVIGTGSTGNAYLIQAPEGSLLLDAGVLWKQMISALPQGLHDLKGCLVTHEHKDHCKAVEDLLLRGIPCIMSKGTAEAIQVTASECLLKALKSILAAQDGTTIHLPPYTIRAAKTEHDANEPLCFLIRYNPTGEMFLYATDTYFLRYKFPGVHYWIIECNHTIEQARELLMGENKAMYRRLIQSHMSLDRLLNTLAANDLSQTRSIVLIHLSEHRSDEKMMVDSVTNQTGIRTFAARSGMQIELDNCPF